MLQVTNGKSTLTVSSGAFKSFYCRRGYRVVGDDNSAELPEGVDTQLPPLSSSSVDPSQQLGASNDSEEDEDEEDEGTDESDGSEEDVDLSEIPLSEMDFETLCQYADQLEVERDGLRSRKDLRNAIREHLKSA